jgi:hypothetical protein
MVLVDRSVRINIRESGRPLPRRADVEERVFMDYQRRVAIARRTDVEERVPLAPSGVLWEWPEWVDFLLDHDDEQWRI